MAEAPRGRGSGRARGAGRGGPAQQGRNTQGIPLAAQMRQVTRLQEPDEMAVIRRYKDVGASLVRSVYGPAGLLSREVQLPVASLMLIGINADGPRYVSLLQADNSLNAKKARDERQRALARREVRLPEARKRASWGSLSSQERSLLLMSQKEFNSFRAAGANPAPQATPVQGPASTHVDDDGDDDGDDADAEEAEN